MSPLAPSRVDACNPLLQAHPTWARDKHEGRGIPPLTPVSLRLPPPFALRLAPTHLGWGTRRQFTRRSRDPPGFEMPTETIHHDSQATTVLLASLCREEYNKVNGLENAKEIWDTLKVTHEGNLMTIVTKMELIEGELSEST